MEIAEKFLVGIVIYTLLTYSLFIVIYKFNDFEKHFAVPEGTKVDTRLIMYYAFLVQTGYMAGEITPKTSVGRTIVALHSCFSWILTLALLAPWSAV